ncbi:hypothetical protein AK830_g4646 [Neonectria ditissima]|uniref:F-box domain-containing protein n=1 Tax=Neonectria ditissima TaxID=78410 RepID=A0A0P7BMY2_9HYPO|nr:hypothetical protein AK830_g4646 [Neonectria ditissima]
MSTSSSTPSLVTLPDELFLAITSCLTPHELARLMRTCKRFNALVEPIFWTNIELHEVGFHESSAELKEPPPFIPVSERLYHRKQPWGSGQGAQVKAEKLFLLLQLLHDEDFDRMQELTKRVRNLCTVIEPGIGPWDEVKQERKDVIQIWQLLQFFTNLETLELHGDHYYSEEYELDTPEFTAPPLNLRFAKLFGYIPKSVARWVIRAGDSLERLELGMLDRPISTSRSSEPNFSPLPEENLAEPDDEYSDWGSLREETVIPRPQSGFLPDVGQLSLSRVKHLSFCQPSPGDGSSIDYSWSSRAEDACLDDWQGLIQAAGPTLETLVLEQRPAAEYIEQDGVSELEYLRRDSGSGNGPLVGMVMSLVANNVLPELKKVYLYGMVAGEDVNRRPSEDFSAGRLMTLLEARKIQCEARLGQWCPFDDSPGYAFWASWDGEESEDDYEDEEDEEYEDEESKMKWNTLLASV